MSLPKVLVAGATGYLGKYVVKALHAAGYPVRALARDPSRLGEVRPLCAEVVTAEATKPETLGDLVGDATVLVSSLGKHDFKRSPTTWEIDYQANMNLLERAKTGGVERVVFVSVLRGPELRRRGIRAAQAREGVVDAIEASGLDWTIVRPNGFFNDMADIFEMAVGGTAWLVGDGAVKMNPIHGEDLARFVVEKLGDPAAHRASFDVGGPDVLTYPEIIELAFAAVGKPPRTRSAPGWLFSAATPLVGLVNPVAGDLLRAVTILLEEGAVAPCYGTHHLADFYAELAAKGAERKAR